MWDFIRNLFDSSGMMLHKHCQLFFTEPEITYLGVVANLLIALSYFVIPFVLYKVHVIGDFPKFLDKYLLLFGLFIYSCGFGHLLDIYTTLFSPIYRFEVLWSTLTALLSLLTASVLVYEISKFLIRR